MLSRLSSLFIYVVAGLVISAAATPMGPDYNEEPKSRVPGPAYPQSYSAHPKYTQEKPYSKPYYQMDKAYARREDKPYREEKKYPEQKKFSEEKPYPKPRPEDKKYLNKSSDDKGKEPKSDDYKGRKSDNDKGRKSDNYKDRMSGDYMDRKSDDKDRKDLDKDYDNGRKMDEDNDRKDYDRGRKDYDKGRKDYDKGRKVYSNNANSCGNVGEQHCCDSVNTVRHDLVIGFIKPLTPLFRSRKRKRRVFFPF